MKNVIRFMMVAVLVLSVFSTTGCRSKKKNGGDELLTDTVLTGDEPLIAGARFEDTMMRVTEVSFETVLFAYDSYQISYAQVAKVEKVAEYMKSNPGVRLVAEGNCDERGTIEYNLTLGEQRAAAVRAHLISLGIPSENIQTKSYGEENPVKTGHSESSWRLNRRAEFALYR